MNIDFKNERRHKRQTEMVILRKNKRRHHSKLNESPSSSESEDENRGDEIVDSYQLNQLMGNLFGKKEESVNNKYNHIYFDDAVTKQSCRHLINKIDNLNIKLGKLQCDYEIDQSIKIYLHINSFGGSIFDAFNVIDAIRRNKYPIVTIVEGAVASAATMISIYGNERWITRHGYMLIHQLSSSCWGKMTEIEDEYDNLKELTEHIYSIYEEKTYLKKAQLQKLLKHDRWWSADQCLTYGLVDKII